MGLPRILLADDHREMLEKVTQVLGHDFEVVATVENGERLIEAAKRLDPDVIVLDISLPVLNGFEAVLCLKESASRAKVIFLTVYEDPAFVTAAVAAGALGYVLKTRITVDLIPAIHEALRDHLSTPSPVSVR
ncbi:MAG: response regulator transcription factor [Terriglobales bacterium]